MSTEAQNRIQRLRNPLPALDPITEEEFNTHLGEGPHHLMRGTTTDVTLTYGHIDKADFVKHLLDDLDIFVYRHHVWHGYAVAVERGPEWLIRFVRSSDPEELRFPVTGVYTS